jgi:hypothetical protein
MGDQFLKNGFEKNRKSFRAHLAAGHGELSMMNITKAADVPSDWYVVWRIGENDLGLFAVDQPLIGTVIAGIATKQSMLSKRPHIAAALPQKGTLSGTEISEIKLMVTMLATATERRGRLTEPSSFTPTTLPQHWVRT